MCICREEEPGEDYRYEAEEVEEEEEPWEYDSEALKQWEQFVKKSKAVQVCLAWPCSNSLLSHCAATKQELSMPSDAACSMRWSQIWGRLEGRITACQGTLAIGPCLSMSGDLYQDSCAR